MATFIKAHYAEGKFIISSEMVLPSLRIEGVNSDTYFSDEGAHTYTITDEQVLNFLKSENLAQARLIYGSPAQPEPIDFSIENYFIPENRLTATVGREKVYLFMDVQGQMCFTINNQPSGLPLYRNTNLINFVQKNNSIEVTLDVYSTSVEPSDINILVGQDDTQQVERIQSVMTSTFDMGQSLFKSRVVAEFSPIDLAQTFNFTPSNQVDAQTTDYAFWLEIEQDKQDIQPVPQRLLVETDVTSDELYLKCNQSTCLLIQPNLLQNTQLSYAASYIPENLYLQLKAYQAKFPIVPADNANARPIILIGEVIGQAHDNGSVMFNYLNKYHSKEFDTYYVIRADSSEKENIDKYPDQILDFQSPRHLEIFLQTDLFLHTHNSANLAPFKSDYLIEKISATKKIDLQHGIAGLKAQRITQKPDANEQIVVSSKREVEFVEEEFGYTEPPILLTGLPRFDALLRNKMWSSFKARKHVLIMPTRRRKLIDATDEEFKDSLFFKTYMALINSPELKQMARRKHLHISFVLHPAMQKYAPLFSSDFVKIVDKAHNNVQELLRGNQVMITDYSSVSFDFALQNRPVIYYQFDELVENRHFEIDPHDIVGPVVDNQDDVLFALKNALRQEHLTNAQRSQLPENVYMQMDTHARKRLTKAIQKRFEK